MPSPHVPEDSILADILCLPVEGQPRRSNRGTLQPSVVKGAARYVDSSGIIEKLKEWRDEDDPDRARRGGRPPQFNDRLVFILLMTLLFSGEAPLVTRMAEVLTSRLDTRSRDLLRLPRIQSGTDKAVYHRLYRALRRLIAVVDSAPGTPGTRLTRAEVDAIKASRDPEVCARKQARLIWLSNAMLEATFQMLPEETRSRWKGNLCVDATLIRGWGKDGSPTFDARNLTRDISQDLMSPDIDSGWYYRDADHREPPHTPGRTQPKRAWGNEAHLAVMTANDPTVTPDYPLLVLGISFDLPAGRVGENAMTAIRSIIERGHPAGFFVADRAYLFNSIPSKLQLPARALGYQLCGDYRDDQLGLQGSHNGANLVEGNWYSPSMPEPLIEATRQFRAKEIDEDTYRQRISQRTQYLFRNKQAPSDSGANVMFCPARGPGATATCSLAGPGPVTLGIPTARTRILTPPAHPATCCTNRNSVTFPAEAGAKYRQELQYGTPEWHALYSTLRNTIEGFNGYVKSPTDEDLEQAARRRMRGYTVQFIFTTAMIAASNVRKIKSFVIRESEPARPPRVRARRRRRGPSLQDYRPDPNAPPQVIPGVSAA